MAGDWGSSSFRLYLCDAKTGRILQQKRGRGIKSLKTGLASELREEYLRLSLDWFNEHGSMPCILSGMVGSNIGWQEIAYIEAPCPLNEIAQHCQRIEDATNVFLVPGLTCTNRLGVPDVMRGEELQLIGWAELFGNDKESQIICLPGTHNKWVSTKNKTVDTFSTAFTGELYALLQDHSLLKSAHDSDAFERGSFIRGVEFSHKASAFDSLHTMFSTRSLQLNQQLDSMAAPSYLSGLLIGADIQAAKLMYKIDCTLSIIAESELADKYQIAANALGIESRLIDPYSIAEAGYWQLYQSIFKTH